MDFIRIINKVYCKVHFVFRIMYIHLLENLIKTVSDIKIVHVFLPIGAQNLRHTKRHSTYNM